MKKYWYVLIEKYDTGEVLAAVIKSKMAVKKPKDFHKKEYKREIKGVWCESKAIADELVRQELSKRKAA
jgi:hypothetical protein